MNIKSLLFICLYVCASITIPAAADNAVGIPNLNVITEPMTQQEILQLLDARWYKKYPDQRGFFGGTQADPQRIYGSKLLHAFTQIVIDASAETKIPATVAARKINKIESLVQVMVEENTKVHNRIYKIHRLLDGLRARISSIRECHCHHCH